MSTLSDAIHDVASLLYPARCVGCDTLLENRTQWICSNCMIQMPMTNYHLYAENNMAIKIKGLIPQVENAAALFYHIDNGHWRGVIHQIKYRHIWHSALKLGRWWGNELRESPLYQDIDCIIPVPLHPWRIVARRYNQSDKIAQGLAHSLNTKVIYSALRRVRNNKSQVEHDDYQRWQNVKSLFELHNAQQLDGKHILLVDDVFTTGATLVSCAETILNHTTNTKISIVTLSISSRYVLGSYEL